MNEFAEKAEIIYGEENMFYYTDTDSFIFDSSKEENIKEYINN